jgi:acyl-CoA thioester hydrolase
MPREFPQPEFRYRHFVSYGETDAMGVLYNAEYLHLFERARSFAMRELGMSYAEVEKRGVILPVREACCRYRKPVSYDQEVIVRVGVEEWKKASMRFAYEIRDPDMSTVYATGMTEHACVSPDGRIVRCPDWLRDLFR